MTDLDLSSPTTQHAARNHTAALPQYRLEPRLTLGPITLYLAQERDHERRPKPPSLRLRREVVPQCQHFRYVLYLGRRRYFTYERDLRFVTPGVCTIRVSRAVKPWGEPNDTVLTVSTVSLNFIMDLRILTL